MPQIWHASSFGTAPALHGHGCARSWHVGRARGQGLQLPQGGASPCLLALHPSTPLANPASTSRAHRPLRSVPCPHQEEKVLAFWDEIDAFKTQLKLTEGQPECALRCFALAFTL